MKKSLISLAALILLFSALSVSCFAGDGSDMVRNIFNIDLISDSVSYDAQDTIITVFETIDGFLPLPFSLSLAILAVISLIECFFGYRLIRGQIAITTLFAGYFVAAKFSDVLYKLIPSYPEELGFIAFAIFAIILAVIASKFFNVGVFALIFVIIYSVLPGFIDNKAICLIISLLAAVVSVILVKYAVIVVTSLFFGMLCGLCISAIAGIENEILVYLPGIAVSALGLLIQFSHEKRAKKKKTAAKEKV